MSANKKIYVIFYTTYGHIWKLVEEVVKGINAVDGTEAVVFQVGITATSSYNQCDNCTVMCQRNERDTMRNRGTLFFVYDSCQLQRRSLQHAWLM